MMMYREFKEMKQKEFNALPTMFAFNKSQLDEQLEKIKANRNEIVSLGCGMFMRKADLYKLEAFNGKYEAMKNQLMENDEFLLDAFLYELRNHEYIITREVDDALSVFDLTVDDVMKDDRMLVAINKAMNIIEREDFQW